MIAWKKSNYIHRLVKNKSPKVKIKQNNPLNRIVKQYIRVLVSAKS